MMNENVEHLSRRQRAQVFQQENAQRHDLTTVMNTPEGRNVLRRIIDMSGVFEKDAHPERRGVGLALIAELTAINPHIFPKMMMEGANELVLMNKPNTEDQSDVS